jgi:hypothetical protein
MKMSKWSQERINSGEKRITSRSMAFPDDPDVLFVFEKPIPLWIIKEFMYREEGARSPEELQSKINQIWRRRVDDTKELYVHVLRSP